MAAGGYFGRALLVDAGTEAATALPLSDDLLRAYIGGVGLGAWLMHRLARRESIHWPLRPRSRLYSPHWSAPR